VKWILDTDCLSLLQRGDINLIRRISNTNPKQIFITIITAEEQLRGRLDTIRMVSSGDDLSLPYLRLRDTLEDIRMLNLLDFTQEASNCYEDLRGQKIRIGTRDLRIAATALSVNGIVVTRNRKDFIKVPNLKIEDWTVN
jgi:tRNA(fMet)-specific endonuclease VapC